MTELIYNIRYVFQEYLSSQKVCFFNIPEYQRGYKWSAENVTQLLNDLKNFGNHRQTTEEFYCLQNITVAKGILKDIPCMNVIDGQQRLTTLFIIISYIQRSLAYKIIPVEADMLRYSVRESTDVFLREKVQTGFLWDKEINPNDAESKDQYYIMEVAKAVGAWFQENTIANEVILDNLKLIVNQVDNGDEETVFASLNGGKVDLDGADLIRAILITRAARQKYPTIVSEKRIRQIANDDIDMNIHISVSSQGKIHEYRVKLGVELDKMSLWWSDKDVIDYFEQLLPNRITQNRDFKFREYPIDLLYYAFYEAFKSKLPIAGREDMNLRHFENGVDMNSNPGDDHLEFWHELKELHLTLMDWYNDAEMHNLVGYLMYNFKSDIITFEHLYTIWKEAKGKADFKNTVKRIIRYQLATMYGDVERSKEMLSKVIKGEKNENIEDKLIELRKDILNTSTYNWYESALTSKILPLLDILPRTIEKGNRQEQVIIRLKQQYLKHITSEEDKEHVRSQTRQIDENCMTEEDKQILLEENRKGLNSIGNIVLLHKSINRSYGNDILILKMVRIYSEHVMDNVNAFIRPHTLDVFMSKMKNIDANGVDAHNVYWSEEDIKCTVRDIDTQLASYFELPEIPTENIETNSLNNG